MRFSKGLLVFQQHNFQSRHDIRKIESISPSICLVWNKIKRLFSKARRFHLMWSWKTAACLLQAAETPRHYPSSRIRGECGKRCSKILRRKGWGETLGETWMMESQDTRGFGLSKISKCLADMTCKTTVPPKSLLKESVPRWSSRYARSGEAGQGELWPWQKKGEWISVQALTTNPPPEKRQSNNKQYLATGGCFFTKISSGEILISSLQLLFWHWCLLGLASGFSFLYPLKPFLLSANNLAMIILLESCWFRPPASGW